ncbi:sigma-54-dependent Fis family transcriptional regulator [Ammoniphilus sp. YIM 78166]|uniref:sigma-54 interaction domain-containing protein n=1 Tax=Ammoniphilus sp. YIM 78166 TaxID=1644106 RepID=UPI001F0DC20A|nr:sigma 54-interacting transcriptional regulator [Ammoniphilus sp. YIM 78166]
MPQHVAGIQGGLSLLLDGHLYIRSIAADGQANDPGEIFQIGSSLHDVDWGAYFVTPPEIGKPIQSLMSHQGEMVAYSWKEIRNPAADGIEFVLTLLNLSTIPSTALAIEESLDTGENRLIMKSETMQRVMKIIHAVAQVDSTVLLLGESGVGKSAIAHLIHRTSSRANKPFISVNCGAFPEHLIEAELFGYEHGSFTGGKKGGAMGLFEVAHEGTIFLDEIAELPYSLQAKLLNVLQENTIRKVGSTVNKKINVRILAATNKDLAQMVKEKSFREDLFYRLNVVPLTIPSLRERKEDIPDLIDYFLSKYNKKYGLFMQLRPQVKDELLHYNWPGNIRELENRIERMVVTNSQEGLDQREPSKSDEEAVFPPLKQAKKQLEKELILKAYQLYANTYKVAEVLEVDQSTIVKKLKEYRKG